jgi:uncharacterized protein
MASKAHEALEFEEQVKGTTMRRRLLRLLAAFGIISLIAAFALVIALSVMGYNVLSRALPACGNTPPELIFTPANFAFGDMDTTAYQMNDFQRITFPSREDGLTIAAFYVPSAALPESDTRTVILTHGVSACKSMPSILLAAGMLHRRGYNVLMLDLREHGESPVEDNRHAAGSEEYRDVLGAFDWLTTARGIPAANIGLFGISLGGATSLIAFGEEPRIRALWNDSGFADVRNLVVGEVLRLSMPPFLTDTTLLTARLLANDDLEARTPLMAMATTAGRTVFITHGSADTLIPIANAYQLEATIRAAGGSVQTWYVDGATHTEAMGLYPAEYEARLLAFFEAALD